MIRLLATLLIFSFTLSVFVHGQECEERETGDFSSVLVRGEVRLEIYPSTKDSLVFTIKNALPENIITENEEGELSIRLSTDTPRDAGIIAKLYYSELQKITAEAGALVRSSDTLKMGSLSFECKSGSKMELSLDLNSLTADVKQGGILVFSGYVDRQEVSISSSGTYSAFGLESTETFIRATTAGRGKVTAKQSIDAVATTTAYISYKGDPFKTRIKNSFGGEVVKLEK